MNNYKLSLFSSLGPGILFACAAVGGSHLIASTQAGAIFGWQLVGLILLINLLKYPFFRFAVEYTMHTKEHLLFGYLQKGKAFLWVFFIFSLVTSFVNNAAIAILSAAILKIMLPSYIDISVPNLSIFVLLLTYAILLFGKYSLLDNFSKIIMIALSLATVAAVVIASFNPREMVSGFEAPNPFDLAYLAFMIALMGWMPAPLEFAAINSLWISEKNKRQKDANALFDFNVGYISTAILAVVFLALGALIQYGQGEELQKVGTKYVAQLVDMYVYSMGDWSKLLITCIAFLTIFGSTLSAFDGYSRLNMASANLLFQIKDVQARSFVIYLSITLVAASCIILFFISDVALMLKVAMIISFIFAPIFAYLNYSLIRDLGKKMSKILIILSFAGLIYLSAFTLLFVFSLF